MSFYSFTEGAQGVTTISDAPEPVASALAQANWSRRPLTSGRRKRRRHLAT
jgi:hypothetical protein